MNRIKRYLKIYGDRDRTARQVVPQGYRGPVTQAEYEGTDSYNDNGVILFEDDLRVVIATGLDTPSANVKTGDMVQVWILHRTLSPLGAIRTGRDNVICGSCPHRGIRRLKANGRYGVVGRRCYVEVDKAATGIWRCYRRGRYRHATASQYESLFGGRYVRFGAYGDPVYIPLDMVASIAAVAKGWTGYTHQWLDSAYVEYRRFFMASVDNDVESFTATAQGWRYFRVRATSDLTVFTNEIRCPASAEGGNLTTCDHCRLCSGSTGDMEGRKSITIIDHSRIAKSQPLISITPLAATA